MWLLAWRSLCARIRRYLLIIFSVVLGVGFLAATLTLRDTLANVADTIADIRTGGDIELVGEAVYSEQGITVRDPVPDDLADLVRSLPAVAAVRPNYFRPVALLNEAGEVLTTGSGPTFLLAASPEYPRPLLRAGQYPRGPHELAVSEDKFAALGLSLGDRLEIVVGHKIQRVTLVGMMQTQAPLMGITLMYGDPEQVEQLYAGSNALASLSVFLPQGRDGADATAAMMRELKPLVGDRVYIVPGSVVQAEIRAIVERNLGFIPRILLAFVAVALFISIFVIGNTFQASVRREMRELALARTLGMQPRQIRAMVLIQGALIAVMGVLGGLAAAHLAMWAIARGLAHWSIELEVAPLSAGTAVISLAVGLSVTLAGALGPALAAGRVSPLAAMRTAESSAGRIPWALIPLAVVLGGGGLALLRSFSNDASEDRMAVFGWGALGLTLATLLVLAMVVRPIFGVIAALAGGGRAGGRRRAGRAGAPRRAGEAAARGRWRRRWVIPSLAAINGARFPLRTAATAGALAIGLALMSAAATVTASVKDGISSTLRESVKAEVLIGMAPGVPGNISDEVIAQVAGIEGIDRVDGSLQRDWVTADFPTGGGHRLTLMVADPRELAVDLNITMVAGKPDSLRGRGVWIAESAARSYHVEVGEPVEITGFTSTHTVEVTGIFRSTLLSGQILATPELGADLGMRNPQRSWAFVHLAPEISSGPRAEQVRAEIRAALRPYRTLAVFGPEEMSRQMNDVVGSIVAIFYGITALASVAAVLGITNTLSLAVSERLREIGLLRVIGLSRSAIGAAIVLEAIITSVLGAAAGCGLGVALARIAMTALESYGITRFVVPTAHVGIMAAVAIVMGTTAAIIPAVRGSRVPLMQAVAQD